jgi:hypothetical protein
METSVTDLGTTSNAVRKLANWKVSGMFTIKAVRYLSVLACGLLALSFGWATEPPTAPAPHSPAAKPQQAAPKPPAAAVEKTFAIALVTTDLQRRLIRQEPAPVAIVFLDGAALFRDPKTLDLAAIDFKGIEKGLATYKSDAQRGIHFNTLYVTPSGFSMPSQAGRDLLDLGWEGLGRKAGFGQVKCSSSFGSIDRSIVWEDWIAPLREATDATAEEAAVGDDHVRGYPVRTPLSRVLFSKAVDGVIIVQVKLDSRKDDWIPADVEKSANAAITALKLPKGKKVCFYFNLENGDRDNKTLDRLRELAKRWAADHGLEMEYFNCS